MNFSPFKADIDDLIDEFAKSGGTTLADMKRVWLSKKFSHIFQGSPSVKQGLFMQSLYSHAMSYMASTDSLSRRLGGLYCLYCLYETQPFKPPFKIYVSLGYLKKLRNVVIDAKLHAVTVAPYLVKTMLERKMFLYGAVELNETSRNGMIGQITEWQIARVQLAYEKLFANTRIEQFLHMDLDSVCDLSTIDQMSTDYAEAKKAAIQGTSKSLEDVSEEGREAFGNKVAKISEKWNAQRELFYQQTGLEKILGKNDEEVLLINDKGDELDEFGHSLEMQLLEDEQMDTLQ